MRKNIKSTNRSHNGRVIGITVDEDNSRIITYGEDGSFIIWEEGMD